ncbi:MAG TPA: glycosyltransferase [Thermoanaerobaculia bacterium]
MARPEGTGERPPGRLGVLLVSHSLGGGGAERFAATLAARLDRGRFRPAVCVATGGGAYPVPADVPVAELGYRGLLDLPGAVVRLARRLRREPPDLVLSNVLSTNCLTGAALGLVAERPAWVARVGNAPEHGDPLLQRLWARRVYPRADRIVTNSRGLREGFLRYYPGLEERCRALPNPTDFQEIDRLAAETPPETLRVRLEDDLSAGAARLLWVGRLGRQKRPDLALETLARLRALPGGPLDARLWICGEGPWRGRLERRAAALGLGGAVRFLGFQENPFTLMRAADLLLLTSDFEGLPNALIEAQGLGLPAVATRCDFGPDEVVADGETGVLVPTGDPEALAAAAAALLGDPERRRRMGEAAARRARELFGFERVLPRWEALLEEAARGAR